MRLKILFRVDPLENILPMNYQYPVASWIYRTIHAGDSGFSLWLHEQGYSLENKRFKLFTFGDIFNYPYWKRLGDRIKIASGKSELQISFYVEKAVEHFIIGLFQNQWVEIGDRRSKARFEVQTVERLADPLFKDTMSFRCLSPVCLSKSVEDREHPQYMAPGDPDYSEHFFNNLIYKYMAAGQTGQSFEELKSGMTRRQPMSLSILDKPVSRLVTVKAGTPQESRVRGYSYRFKITAPVELIEVGYHAGFGEKNSMGFGCVGV